MDKKKRTKKRSVSVQTVLAVKDKVPKTVQKYLNQLFEYYDKSDELEVQLKCATKEMRALRQRIIDIQSQMNEVHNSMKVISDKLLYLLSRKRKKSS